MKKIGILILLAVLFSACNSVKRVKESEQLLTKNNIDFDGKKSSDPKLNELIVQKPNNRTLGLPLSLYFYNIGNEDKPKTPSEWGEKKPKTYNFIKGLFSEKQSIAFANSMIGLNNWFLKNGQAPVVIDERKTRRTVRNLDAYLKTQGYYQVQVESRIDSIKKKKAIVNYIIQPGIATYIDSVKYDIKSPVLDSLYSLIKNGSFIKSGDQIRYENFNKEADRIPVYPLINSISRNYQGNCDTAISIG